MSIKIEAAQRLTLAGFEDWSPESQARYLKKHPNSKWAKGKNSDTPAPTKTKAPPKANVPSPTTPTKKSKEPSWVPKGWKALPEGTHPGDYQDGIKRYGLDPNDKKNRVMLESITDALLYGDKDKKYQDKKLEKFAKLAQKLGYDPEDPKFMDKMKTYVQDLDQVREKPRSSKPDRVSKKDQFLIDNTNPLGER